MSLTRRPYRETRIPGLAGGLNDTLNQTLLNPDQSPNALNVEFNRETVQSAKGAIKFNNQVAPRSGFRSRIDQSFSPLYIESGKAVPLRGYGYIPYSPDYDFGGDFASDTGGADFVRRRGVDFELNVTFKLPLEEKLYEAPTLGAGAPVTPDAAFNPPNGYDEALDECFTIIQKGGDRATPMSWALAVVNIGNGALTTASPQRVSNYALCWIWYDAAGWGATEPATMKYNLTSGQNPKSGGASAFCTTALRSILIHKFIEPGKRYSVVVQLRRDSGTPGSPSTNTAWNGDGSFQVWVSEDEERPTQYYAVDTVGVLSVSGMEVHKGPQDSIDYLVHYGIRYSGRDAMFWGLGFRPHVWRNASFIPWGADAAPIQTGGYRMIDRSNQTRDSIFGIGIYTLTATHTLGDAYVTINHRGFSGGNTHGGTDPMGFFVGGAYTEWDGLNAFANVGTPFNPEALRGYRLVTTADDTDGTPDAKGMIMNILSYAETPGFRVTVSSGAAIGTFGAARPVLVQAYRWHQREIETCELRIWKSPRAYDDADQKLAMRRRNSIHGSIEIDDATEPDLANLLARWPADDSGGSVLRESVSGGKRHGFFAPFGLGVSDGGSRGPNLLFLSGEGEACKIDFSTNPIAKRLIERMLGGHTQGFAVEMTCVMPEASYSVAGPPETLPDGGVVPGFRPRFVSDLITWDVPDPDASGMKSVPRTIISLTHRALRNNQTSAGFPNPVAWSAEVANHTDQENIDPVVHSDLLPLYRDGGFQFVNRYDTGASWVGRSITIQVGIQPVVGGGADQYDVYIAMRPKSALNPASGDPADAEFAYFSAGGTTYGDNPGYFTSAHITIRAKDLARSVVTIGGRWSPRAPAGAGIALGYSELNARILLDEVRVFATAGPGALPVTNGGIPTRDGKLSGSKCLPARLLTEADILQPLGRGLRQVNLVEDSVTVLPAGGGKFFTAEPGDTVDSVKDSMLIVRGDEISLPSEETVGEQQEDFYRIESVNSDGSSLTLSDPFQNATRSSAVAAAFRLLFYTAFDDDLEEKDLSLGAGNAYNPATSTITSALIVDDLWKNLSPVTVAMGLRIYSPLGRGTLADLLPAWVRGLVSQRKNPILGIASRNGVVYAGARGSLFVGDDRWREDGPTQAITTSLAFRGAPLTGTAISIPRHDDRLLFQGAAQFFLNPNDNEPTYYEAWVKLDEISESQTIVWVGDPTTDPSQAAGSTLNRAYLILRLTRGVPEFVVGSTATPATEKGLYVATANGGIQRGVWTHIRWSIATRGSGTILKIPALQINGRNVGVTVNAVDSGIGAPTSSDWMLVSNLLALFSTARLLIGVAHDSYKSPRDETAIAARVEQMAPSRIQGLIHSLNGQLAELAVLGDFAWSGSGTGTPPPNFDPYNIDYSTLTEFFHILGAVGTRNVNGVSTATGQAAIGHKVTDFTGFTADRGVIRSSPFVSVFHEFGRSNSPVSWAQFGETIFAANGGRPAAILNDVGAFAGELPPGLKPSVTIERFPVWVENVRDKLTAPNPANDPIDAGASGATPINHYRSTGNAFFTQSLSSTDGPLMAWATDKYMAFKCYWRPQSIAGRISIWRKGNSAQSGGPFVECRDGKCAVGWYDSALKKEVWVETSSPVFTVGAVHYIYIRKRFPQNDRLEGNWVNEFCASDLLLRRVTTVFPFALQFTIGETVRNLAHTISGVVRRYKQPSSTTSNDGFLEYVSTGGGDFPLNTDLLGDTSGASARTSATIATVAPMNDVMVVRKLRTTAPSNTTVMELDEVDTNLYTVPARTARNAVSFTSEVAQYRPAGTTATGFVGHSEATYSVAVGSPGQITANAFVAAFHPQMVGMYFQFGSGANAGTLYRIVSYTNPLNIQVVDASFSTPTWATASGLIGGPFSGITLIKSPDFDLSKFPDTNGDIEFLGTKLQGVVLSGFSPHEGEMWTPGWTCQLGTGGQNAQVFENVDSSAAAGTIDPANVGADRFGDGTATHGTLYDGVLGEPGELHFNGTDAVNEPTTPTATFWTTDSQTYNSQGGNASSQPNGTASSPPSIVKIPTNPPRITASNQADPVLSFIQDPATWGGRRFIACAIFDPVQNIVSNPGPILDIAPSAEDPKNPSGSVRFLLSGLPQRKNHELWIYESLSDGDQATQFRVARFDATCNEFAVEAAEAQIALGPVLEFTNLNPPACYVVGATGTRVWYAAFPKLKQLDGVMYSKIGQPASIRLTLDAGFFRLASGFGDQITGLQALDEVMLVTKDHAIAVATINAADQPQVEPISSGVGSPSGATIVALDDRVYLQSERGTHEIARQGVTNLGKPTIVSQPLENYFSFTVDRRYARSLAAALNRQRDQYVVLIREVGKTRIQNRISVEVFVQRGGEALNSLAPSSHRFGRYETPNLSAIAAVQGAKAGQERMVGGTDDGFLVWLDRDDTQNVMLGSTAAIYGDVTLVAAAGSTQYEVVVASGIVDVDLEGPRGCTMRFLDANGVERSVSLLGAANIGSNILFLDEKAAASVPSGATLLLGSQQHRWESPWMDMGNFERLKQAHYLNLNFRVEASGTLLVECFADLDDSAPRIPGQTITLSEAKHQIVLGQIEGRWLKFKISNPFPATGTKFELVSAVWRTFDEDQD
jgi:hypothetical protein